MQAIILAGGKGTRLMPLTQEKPKPMIPVIQKPLMEYTIDLLKYHGINNVAVTVMHLSKYIKDYFQDGKNFDVNIKYVEENTPRGTAGSVKLAQNIIEDETFIVLSGDALTNIDINKIHKYHKSIGADVTIVLSKQKNPLDYGVVLTETDGRVTSFIEKPQWENVVTNTVNTGIYIIEKHVLNKIPTDSFYDFSKDLFPVLLKENYKIYGYITEDYWCDLGNPESYLKANIDILQGNVFGKRYENVLEENVVISEKTKLIPPVYIGKNTVISGETTIGPNAIIGQNIMLNNVKIKNSLIWDKTIINNCELDGEVVGENTEIDNAEFLGNNVIGSNVKIKNNVILKNGSTVYNNVSIAPESVLTGDIRNSVLKETTQFIDGILEGAWNHNITANTLLGIASSFKENKMFVSSNKTPLGIALRNLLASFYCLCGSNVYVFDSYLNSCRFFSSINEIQGVYIEENNEFLQIHLIDKNGLNCPLETEKKIDFNFVDYSINRGKIIKINSVDSDFEYFLNAAFPFGKINVELYSNNNFSLHNVMNKKGEFNSISSLAKASIITKDNTLTDVYYEDKRVSSLNYLKLKLDIAKQLKSKEVFMPAFVDEEILNEAKESGIKIIYKKQHIGNSMQQVDKFNNTAILLEYVPEFFAQALAYYLHKKNIEINDKYVIAKYNFDINPEKSLETIFTLNKNKTTKSITANYKGGFITVIPRNNGYSFTAYGKFLKEEYAPDILEEFINKNIDK